MIPQLLDIKDCSQLLKIPVGTLRNWVSQKRIPYVKLGGRCLFNPKEIERWLEESTIREQLSIGDLGGLLTKKNRSNQRPSKTP